GVVDRDGLRAARTVVGRIGHGVGAGEVILVHAAVGHWRAVAVRNRQRGLRGAVVGRAPALCRELRVSRRGRRHRRRALHRRRRRAGDRGLLVINNRHLLRAGLGIAGLVGRRPRHNRLAGREGAGRVAGNRDVRHVRAVVAHGRRPQAHRGAAVARGIIAGVRQYVGRAGDRGFLAITDRDGRGAGLLVAV